MPALVSQLPFTIAHDYWPHPPGTTRQRLPKLYTKIYTKKESKNLHKTVTKIHDTILNKFPMHSHP